MTEMTVDPVAATTFAAATDAVGAATATAAPVGTVAQGAVLAGCFGLIGQEFLAAFATAQAGHLSGVGALAAVHAATAEAVRAGVTAYGSSDAAGAAGIRA